MIALTWTDVNMFALEVNVLRSCVRNRFGNTKTAAIAAAAARTRPPCSSESVRPERETVLQPSSNPALTKNVSKRLSNQATASTL